MGDPRNSAVACCVTNDTGDMNPVESHVDHDDNEFGDGENKAFFFSLYETLEGSSSSSHRQPDLRFAFDCGEEWVEAHLVVMDFWCENLPKVFKREDGRLICGVPESLRVSPESFRIFRKAIYLKTLPSKKLTFEDRAQVRRLAVHFGCRMVLEKCDDVQISSKNCHIFWDKWPEGTEVRKRAMELVKGNLKTLIETETYLDWSEKFWLEVLSLNDLTPGSCPTEDDVFLAGLKWQDKNKSTVDTDKFGTLFRDMFRYPLMPENFLLYTVRKSGILDHSDIFLIYDEINGHGVTRFNKTPRTSTSTPLSLVTSSLVVPEGTTSSSSTTVVAMEDSNAANDLHMSTTSITSSKGNNKRSEVHARKSGNNRNLGPLYITRSFLQTKSIGKKRGTIQDLKRRLRRMPMPQSSTMAVAEADPNIEFDMSLSKRKRYCSPKELSPRILRNSKSTTPLNTPPKTATSVVISSLLPSPSYSSQGNKKTLVATFAKLQEVLRKASAGEEIYLSAGRFDGQLDICGLPEGVSIIGAAEGGTIITASRAPREDCTWRFHGCRGLSFQDLRFERESPRKRKVGDTHTHTGLGLLSTDGVKIHSVTFLGCYLGLLRCRGADLRHVTVESSSLGIWLQQDTKNTLVEHVTFNGVNIGIQVHGSGNKISDVTCDDVQIGVELSGTSEAMSFGNSLSDLSFTFPKGKVSKKSASEQNGVRIIYSRNNVVTNVKCLRYNENVSYETKPLRTHVGACALWIRHTGKGAGPSSPPNRIIGVSGGPVWVGGEGNIVENVSDCGFLQARGSGHQFTNCQVLKADTKLARTSVYNGCNFDAESSAVAAWVAKGVSID